LSRYAVVLAGVMALSAGSAVAQTVFFDDFDGNALLPHWGHAPSRWEYNVGGGVLNVTNVVYPSSPKSPVNFASMSTSFAPQGDFRVNARMGWGTVEGVFELDLRVQNGGGILGRVGYAENPYDNIHGVFGWAFNGPVFTRPSPPPGIYEFSIARIGTNYEFYFEGTRFATFAGGYSNGLDRISLTFSSRYPGPSGPFQVDLIQVVPAPAAGIVLLGAQLLVRRKRT
jgi:hypothetical protein